MTTINDFQAVSFDKDRERAFAELAVKSTLVTGWTPSSKPLFFHVQRVEEMSVSLLIVDGDGLSAKGGESIELLFSIDDGQYHWVTSLVSTSADVWTITKGGELSRLQRRANFRTSIPLGFKANMLVRAFRTHSISPTDLLLVDVSAGGARLKWPAAGLSSPSQGDSLAGVITAPGGRQIEVFGLVKSVLTDVDTNEIQVGVEFQNLSQRDEQALLHLCLQIRRAQSPIVR